MDAGTVDVGSLSASLLVVQPDLRVGSDWEHVYRNDDGSFYRVQGGLVATFPHSEYVQTRRGEQAVIPAGTVFSFGAPLDLSPSDRVGPGEMVVGVTPTNGPARVGGALSQSVSRRVSSPVEGLMTPLPLARPIEPRPVEAEPSSEAASQAEAGDRKLDVSNEYYRRYRLQQISGKYGPKGEDR